MDQSRLTLINNWKDKRGHVDPSSRIIAVGGGKGGIGKSFVSAHIAYFLARLGHKTLLVDLDFGAANLHTYLHENPQRSGLSDFLNHSNLSLADVAVPTKYKNLSLVGGNDDPFDIADLSEPDKTRLMSGIFRSSTDVIVLDLSAGTTGLTLDFFGMATDPIVTTTPDPSSIENAYRFLRAAFYRKVRRFEEQLGLSECISHAMTNKNQLGIKTPSDLLRFIDKNEPHAGRLLTELITKNELKILVNQARTKKEGEIGKSIASLCGRYFGQKASSLGYIEHDNAVWQALRKRQLVIEDSPFTKLYPQLLSIAKSLSHPTDFKAVV